MLNTQDGGINIQDNYFQVPQENIDYLKAPSGFPQPQVRCRICKELFLGLLLQSSLLITEPTSPLFCSNKLKIKWYSFPFVYNYFRSDLVRLYWANGSPAGLVHPAVIRAYEINYPPAWC